MVIALVAARDRPIVALWWMGPVPVAAMMLCVGYVPERELLGARRHAAIGQFAADAHYRVS